MAGPRSARETVLDFVEAVIDGPDAVPPEERVAVFDNDGTLWTEKPMPTQLHYVVEQWAAAVWADPTLAERQPYRTAEHQTLQRPYSAAVYRPMVELLRHLEDHGFTCYIVSGGDRDFMRPMTTDYYGIPPERVVGTAIGMEYDEETNQVRYGTTLRFFDDGPEKPVRIWTRVGRRPILAAGNPNGDLQMLRYVQEHPRSLSLLVHHDDDTGRGDAPYDTGAEGVLAGVDEHGLVRVSVKDDWSTVFVT